MAIGTEENTPGERRFRVEQRVCGEVTVLDLTGSLTGPRVTMLRKKLAMAVARRSTPFIAVDTTRVDEIDSFGCRILVGASRHARDADGLVIIVGSADWEAPGDEPTLRPSLEEALIELAKRRR
ncbi:STAS domain-containing protein [Nonomuraea polychroma]|uniref:STAS domain-containing protein n=1 Tax=Nonomuraea polychroma TaxID=46176 RepID=UPI003D923D2F